MKTSVSHFALDCNVMWMFGTYYLFFYSNMIIEYARKKIKVSLKSYPNDSFEIWLI